MVMDDQCQFYRDAKHTMRECEYEPLESRLPQRRPEAMATMTTTVANASTIVIVDLIDEITVTAGPIFVMTIGIDVIIARTTAAMTAIAMIATTGATTIEVIIVMIAMMIVTTTDEMTDVMIDVARMTTVPATTTGRSGLHHHRPKGATPMVHSRRLTPRSTSSLEVAKRLKATDRLDQMPRRSGTSTPKTRDLYGGPIS
jgi:hypothetical protein